MKISLNWVFDHIEGALSSIDIAQLVDSFIRTTAEIEGWKKVGIAIDELTLVEIVTVLDTVVVVRSPEFNKEYTLPYRTDAVIGSWFIIVDSNVVQRWATSTIFGGVKDMLLPAIYCPENMRNGSWKVVIEREDYIIEVDNKSINSRPDLWCHRGLAREIAAIFNLQLRPLSKFIADKENRLHADNAFHVNFNISVQAVGGCDRFATLYMPVVNIRASDIRTAIRLSRLDSRSIDFFVDATNYVMLDLGQPMHAFDADAFTTKEISVAYAGDKEKLVLLDGETISLTPQDLVIADGDKAVSLAGIMGGAATGITRNTRSILLEAAHFDPVIIRRTSARHKKRTESSMRFEKNIDLCQNIDAIRRFLFLLNQAGIEYKADEFILSLGTYPDSKIITVEHSFIESRLGIIIKVERIVEILEKLAFVVEQSLENDIRRYVITVPSFRATKDVKIPEDIVEEVGRYIGYDMLPRVMPSLQLYPRDLHKTDTVRAIKHFLSYGLQMRELYGYSFFDESMLRELVWQPVDYVEIKNPISENYTRLITTLQPNLLKAVRENSIACSQLRFYEWARVWRMHGSDIIEQKSLSGIFFDTTINFYTGKAFLKRMFDMLQMDVVYNPFDGTLFSWYVSHETALIMHDGKAIGMAGMVDQQCVATLSPAGGSLFVFELDGDYLLDYKKPVIRFNSLSKYPSVRRDVSILINASVTADTLINVIKSVDKQIEAVTLIDFFSKPEWENQKAMTFHVEVCDKERTLTSEVIEKIWGRVLVQLQEQGATIR